MIWIHDSYKTTEFGTFYWFIAKLNMPEIKKNVYWLVYHHNKRQIAEKRPVYENIYKMHYRFKLTREFIMEDLTDLTDVLRKPQNVMVGKCQAKLSPIPSSFLQLWNHGTILYAELSFIYQLHCVLLWSIFVTSIKNYLFYFKDTWYKTNILLPVKNTQRLRVSSR